MDNILAELTTSHEIAIWAIVVPAAIAIVGWFIQHFWKKGNGEGSTQVTSGGGPNSGVGIIKGKNSIETSRQVLMPNSLTLPLYFGWQNIAKPKLPTAPFWPAIQIIQM